MGLPRVPHPRSRTSVRCDRPTIRRWWTSRSTRRISCRPRGLAPVLALAERAGLPEWLAEQLSVPAPNAWLKATALVAGTWRGDSIADVDLLRHGAMPAVRGRACARNRNLRPREARHPVTTSSAEQTTDQSTTLGQPTAEFRRCSDARPLA
jgi:hypothetical protein